MAVRIQVLLDDLEREAFRAEAEREGMSLSAWLRKAGHERLAGARPPTIRNLDELRTFFAGCDAREQGDEPHWSEHLAMIEESKKAGLGAA